MRSVNFENISVSYRMHGLLDRATTVVYNLLLANFVREQTPLLYDLLLPSRPHSALPKQM